MPQSLKTFRRSALAVAAGALGSAVFAAPAAATICPGGVDPYVEYCVNSAMYDTIILLDNPVGYWRMSDADASPTMEDSSPSNHDGEYKNRQSSGPVGITGDGNLARLFWGGDGYGYVNGIPAPGQDNGYLSYTLEAWFYLTDSDSDLDIHNDGTIAQFGGGPSIYILNNTLRFRNGNDVIQAFTTFKDEKWYHVVGRKSGTSLSLYLNASPTAPTAFNFTPVATGSSSYHPGGSPTFYVGYGEHAPWLRGALDEVAYYRYALPPDSLAYHFYADPPPDKVARAAGAAAPGGGTASGPGFSGDSSNPGSKPTVSKSRAAKLKKAKAEVKRLTKLVTKTKRWVGSLKHNFAPLKVIKNAQKKLTSLQKQLKRAKARVKSPN